MSLNSQRSSNTVQQLIMSKWRKRDYRAVLKALKQAKTTIMFTVWKLGKQTMTYSLMRSPPSGLRRIQKPDMAAVRIIGNKLLNNVEVTAQEAVQLPLSHEVVFVNTSQPDERVYLLSSNTDQLADDTEVAESNIITQRLMTQCEWVCRFLTAHQHLKGYSLPCNG